MADSSLEPIKTPAERIQELNAINEQIPQILASASNAISALTNSPSQPTTLAAHKSAFQTSTATFFTAITSLKASLASQADALEAAGIIPATNTKPASREMTAADLAAFMGRGNSGGVVEHQSKDSEAGVRNSGLGDLDVGWLNARAGDVGRGMEAEVLGRVRGLLEGMVGEGEEEREREMRDA